MAKSPDPRQNSTILSKLTFWYTLPLFSKSSKKELEEEDLYQVLPEYQSQRLGDRIEADKSVYQIFWKLVGFEYFLLGLSKIVSILLNVLRPLVLAKFVSYFSPGQVELTKGDARLYGCLLIGLAILDSVYRQNYIMRAQSLAIKLRAALGALIYRRSLNLSVEKSHRVSFGNLANLLTRDVNCFGEFFHIFNESWTGFFTTMIIFYHMYRRVGSAMVVAVLAFGILIPCVGKVEVSEASFLIFGIVLTGIKMTLLKKSTLEKTDQRIASLQEMLSKIKSAKMYVWEEFVEGRIEEARRQEMNILFDFSLGMFSILAFTMLVLHLAHYLVLMTCIYLDQTLTAETIYFLTSAFQTLTWDFTCGIPYATFFGTQFSAALKRFQALLDRLDGTPPRLQTSGEPGIVATDLTLGTVLQNLDFDLGPGLTLVSGPSSSGKSLLLLTILQEFDLDGGTLVTKGRISYVSQEPWLFPSTIRENILFGAKFEEKRYQKVVQVCALEVDFQGLEHGDGTVVAEQGINLSKGQQSRICLARAVYKDSDIYLFDDCLSNLDPLVTDQVVTKCFRRFLATKLVVLVTSNPNLEGYARSIIRFGKNGAQFVRNSHGEPNISSPTDSARAPLLETTKTEVYRERKNAGAVSLGTYRKYIELARSRTSVMVIFLIFLLSQVCISYKDKLVSEWANLESKVASAEVEEERKTTRYLYTGTVVVMVSVIMLRASFLYLFLKKVSINLHQVMLKLVINAKMAVFDQVFIGNIVNRFSMDLVIIDESIPSSVFQILIVFFETMGILVLICSVNVSFLLPSTVFFMCLVLLRKVYLKTGRALKRLEATTKSPIVGSLNAALKGLPTIKTFQAQQMLKEEFDNYQDRYSSASYCNLACMRAFLFVVDLCSSLLFAAIILRFLIFSENATVGDVGLSLSQTFLMSSALQWGFNKWADLETQMTSVERIFEYTKLKQEPKSGLHPEEWPEFGQIHYQNVYLSYDGGKSCVLKNLNFVIESGEKVGIVGRTGSGKSSIISSIFRLYDVEGRITIDGVSTKTLSPDLLRSRISVIPQDPLVFDGTLRYNVNPDLTHSDDEIWNVLDEVKLRHLFPSLESRILETELSFAEKQLICLARVLLRKNRIVFLDEITENGDEETESVIYDLVEKHFGECTVVRITHKMKFALECDRVFVVDRGEIVEQGCPKDLLGASNGLFARMVRKSGLATK